MSEFEKHEFFNPGNIEPEMTLFEPIDNPSLEALLRLVEITKKIDPKRVYQLFSPEDPERKFIEQLIRNEEVEAAKASEVEFVKSLSLVEELKAIVEIENFDPLTEAIIANDPADEEMVPSGINAFGVDINEKNNARTVLRREKRLRYFLGRIAAHYNTSDDKDKKISA
ncbi:MAG: hypothetical protein WCG30_01760 [Candidatus Saccharibacteria bacterium]